MSFVAKHIVGSDERLIGVARLHWVYLVVGLFWAGFAFAVGLGLQYMVTYYGSGADLSRPVDVIGYDLGARSVWISAAFGLVAIGLFLVFFIEYISTEVALTTKRVIRKSGLIAIEVQEIDLDEIDAASIRHGWLGAFLGYGAIFMDCRFVGDIHLPSIRRPYRFLTALRKIKDDPRREGRDKTIK